MALSKSQVKSLYTRSIESAFYALVDYQVAYSEEFEGNTLGSDYILGEAWLVMARNLLVLLNGNIGTLDAGRTERMIRDLAERAGFTRDLEPKVAPKPEPMPYAKSFNTSGFKS